MPGTPREPARVGGEGRTRSAAEQGGGHFDGSGEDGVAGGVIGVIRGEQLRAAARARTSTGGAGAPSLRDRRAAVPELWRSDEADRGHHRSARGPEDARARRGSERRTRAVPGTRATAVSSSIPLARPRAAGGRASAGGQVDPAEHRDGRVRPEIERAAASAASSARHWTRELRADCRWMQHQHRRVQFALGERRVCRLSQVRSSRDPLYSFYLPLLSARV
jgi:hypothetical protein